MTDIDAFEDTGLFDKVLYTILSTVTDADLRDQKRTQIREKRKEFIESNQLLGGPPSTTPRVMEVLVELSLHEAELIDGFEPDLLVVSEVQFKSLFDIGAGVPLRPDDFPDKLKDSIFKPDLQQLEPPREKRFGDYHIDVVYSSATDRMLLVDSSDLSSTVEL